MGMPPLHALILGADFLGETEKRLKFKETHRGDLKWWKSEWVIESDRYIVPGISFKRNLLAESQLAPFQCAKQYRLKRITFNMPQE